MSCVTTPPRACCILSFTPPPPPSLAPAPLPTSGAEHGHLRMAKSQPVHSWPRDVTKHEVPVTCMRKRPRAGLVPRPRLAGNRLFLLQIPPGFLERGGLQDGAGKRSKLIRNVRGGYLDRHCLPEIFPFVAITAQRQRLLVRAEIRRICWVQNSCAQGLPPRS